VRERKERREILNEEGKKKGDKMDERDVEEEGKNRKRKE
jgi:hypothetical protein